MRDFARGDTVRYTADHNTLLPPGTAGTVAQTFGRLARVRFDDSGWTWVVRSTHLEFADVVPAVDFDGVLLVLEETQRELAELKSALRVLAE